MKVLFVIMINRESKQQILQTQGPQEEKEEFNNNQGEINYNQKGQQKPWQPKTEPGHNHGNRGVSWQPKHEKSGNRSYSQSAWQPKQEPVIGGISESNVNRPGGDGMESDNCL